MKDAIEQYKPKQLFDLAVTLFLFESIPVLVLYTSYKHSTALYWHNNTDGRMDGPPENIQLSLVKPQIDPVSNRIRKAQPAQNTALFTPAMSRKTSHKPQPFDPWGGQATTLGSTRANQEQDTHRTEWPNLVSWRLVKSQVHQASTSEPFSKGT